MRAGPKPTPDACERQRGRRAPAIVAAVPSPHPILRLLRARLTPAPVASAATARVDLGPPNYGGYCQSLGFVTNRFTPPPDQRWECLHADGSLSPMNLQAACEFTYTQRPILAQQLLPGVLYSWQCIENAGPAGGSPGSGTGPGSTGTPGAAQLYATLRSELVPTGAAARIGALLRHGGYRAALRAPAPGTITIKWYSVPRGARIAVAHPTALLVASGRLTFGRSGSAWMSIRLTARGRQLLRRPRRITLTARGTFATTGAPAVVALRTFKLTR
jgi:hypothetical protein